MVDNTEKGPDTAGGGEPLLTPAQLAAHYHFGLTKVYEECRSGILRDICVRWGRRLYIPARAARRIFEGREDDS